MCGFTMSVCSLNEENNYTFSSVYYLAKQSMHDNIVKSDITSKITQHNYTTTSKDTEASAIMTA